MLSCFTVRNINFTRQQFECILRETLYSFHALCCIASKFSLHQKVFLECVNAVPHHSKVRGVFNNMFFGIPVKIMIDHSLIPEVYESWNSVLHFKPTQHKAITLITYTDVLIYVPYLLFLFSIFACMHLSFMYQHI